MSPFYSTFNFKHHLDTKQTILHECHAIYERGGLLLRRRPPRARRTRKQSRRRVSRKTRLALSIRQTKPIYLFSPSIFNVNFSSPILIIVFNRDKIEELKFLQKQRERTHGLDVYSLAIGESNDQTNSKDLSTLIEVGSLLLLLLLLK